MLDTYCNADFCRKTLQTYIRINSCQPDGNEGDMVKAILELFPKDVSYTIIDHNNNRQSLIVKIQGERNDGGVALIGHLDTVPYGDAADWQYPPLMAVEDGGYIYGRGAVDMKGGDVVLTAVALSLHQMKQRPKENIYFCFTADEENGGMGAVAVSKLDYIKSVREFFIAEPSNEAIGVVEKGALWLGVKTKGALAHSSRPSEGVNAIEKSLEFLEHLRDYIEMDYQDQYLGRTTIAITKLVGGVSLNVIPDTAEMNVDIRTLSNINHEDVIQYVEELAEKMERENQGLHMQVEILNNRPAVGTAADDPFIKRIEKVYQTLGMEPKKKGMFFYTDASQVIPHSDRPFVIMGPGDDADAHQVNENVELESVVRMAQVYMKYLVDYYY